MVALGRALGARLDESALAQSLTRGLGQARHALGRRGVDPAYPQDRRERAERSSARRWPPSLELASLGFGIEESLGGSLPSPLQERARAGGRALGLLARLCEELDTIGSMGSSEEQCPPLLLSGLASRLEPSPPLLQLAWATWSAPVPDEFTLRSVLCDPALADVVRAKREQWATELRALVDDPHTEQLVEDFLQGVVARTDRAAGLSFILRNLPGTWTRDRVDEERRRAVRLAVSALEDDTSFREAWEVQRWGAWCEEPRIARFFPAGLCLFGLSRAGVDVSSLATTLLRTEASVDGYRYYGHWRGIPPDADDLGLALQLLVLTGNSQLRESLVHPVQLLIDNTQSDGWIPTYLEHGLREPTSSDGPRWLVRRCPAVATNVLIGLAVAGWELPEGYFDRALWRTLEVFRDEGLAAVDAYPACYARLLLARLEVALRDRSVPTRCRQLLDALLVDIDRQLVQSQELDGGWGSPLATACHLRVLVLREVPGFDPAAARIYLALRQEPDGLWPREALYHCPGRDGAQHDYASRSVTTALCLEALATVNAPAR